MAVRVKRRKGSKAWWVYADHHRERKAWKIGTKDAAEEFAGTMRDIIAKGGRLTAPKPQSTALTLEEYYKHFKETYIESSLRESTRVSYEGSFKHHILPELGKFRLDEIAPKDVKRLVANLVKKTKKIKVKSADGKEKEVEVRLLARTTIRIILSEFAALIHAAVEDEDLIKSPIPRKLTRHYKEAPVRHEEIHPLTISEVETFLQTVRAEYPDYYALILCAIHTGLRAGEIAALKWGDIDWDKKLIIVRKTLSRGNVGRTKTDRVRFVDMSDALIGELLAMKETREKEWSADGKGEPPEWVFCNEVGNAVDMKNIYHRVFLKALAKAEIPRRRFHDLRHSYASLLLQQGESLKYIQTQLGHTTIAMTANVYSHLVPGANREAVNKLPVAKIQGENVVMMRKA